MKLAKGHMRLANRVLATADRWSRMEALWFVILIV